MVEKDYGEEFIEPAKAFIEQINNLVSERFGYREASDEDNRDELTKKLFPKVSSSELRKRDQEKNRKMNQKRFMKPGKPSRSGEWGAYESQELNDISKLAGL
jgi:hypothetical protein